MHIEVKLYAVKEAQEVTMSLTPSIYMVDINGENKFRPNHVQKQACMACLS